MYVDNLTIAEAINIKSQIKLSDNQVLPIPYHLMTGHVLPHDDSLVCKELTNILSYSDEHEMQVITKKTKVMLFNQSRTVDIQPEIILNTVEIEMRE